MEDQENNPVIQEIEKEIEETKRKASDENFEIEITEEKEDAKEEATEVKEPKETPEEYKKMPKEIKVWLKMILLKDTI